MAEEMLLAVDTVAKEMVAVETLVEEILAVLMLVEVMLVEERVADHHLLHKLNGNDYNTIHIIIV